MKSVQELEQRRKERQEEIKKKENEEFNAAPCNFLKNRLEQQDKRIEYLEEMIVQLITIVEKSGHKVKW